MRHITLQALTWGTVAAAITSALWLASAEPGWPDSRKATDPAGSVLRIPADPTAAGAPLGRPGASSQRDAARPQRGERPR
jgi:hypothetical protein